MKDRYDFSVELRVTEVYRQSAHENAAIREARCLEEMYPHILGDIKAGDRLAGRICMSYVGFSPEPGGLGYYCDAAAIRRILQENQYEDTLRCQIEEMLAFWNGETTAERVRAAYPADLAQALPSDDWNREPLVAAPLYRMAGSYLDYEKLLQNGIPGLLSEIADHRQTAADRGEDVSLYDGMERALQLLSKCCIYYGKQAEALAHSVKAPKETAELCEMARALYHIASAKPETLLEAMQLLWIYAVISGTINYGRIDVALGDFLAQDLETKRLDMEQAQELFNGLWQLIADRKTTWNGRVILGGKGRKKEENANLAALLGLEATRVVREIEPQLTLRCYEGMDERLMEKALEVIGEGRTYPMLYNDEVNIPSVASAFQISREEAEGYVPFGCGEYVIEHKSFGSPNGIINLLKALEITLRNGADGITGRQAGPKTGKFKSFKTFEQLWEAYTRQVEYFMDALARQEAIEYQVAGETAPFLYLSMLYDDCVERGKGIFSGGIKYLGGTVETYGNINTADSLTAIKEVVYDKGLMTQEQLLAALEADFVGYSREAALLGKAAKYGNDLDQADEMAIRIHEHICNAARKQSDRVGLHSYLVVIINNSANTTLGQLTAASADGRRSGIHMANANNPWGGNDKNGLTAMLNSLVKLRTDIHAGAVQNMMFTPDLFKGEKKIMKTTLKTYFQKGGQQAMLSVVNKEDLEQAMLTPEKYSSLMVRVGGFSARFVELDKPVQLEILSRTQY